MKPLRLEILFGSKDKLSPALRLLVSSSKAAASASKQARDELNKLSNQQKLIENFQKLKNSVKQATIELESNKKAIKVLREQLAIQPDAKLSQELKIAEDKVKKLSKVVADGTPRLMTLRNELNNAGLKSKNLANYQEELKNKINSANHSIESQKNKLANLSRLQQSHNRLSTGTQKMAMYGMGAAGTGVAALYQMRKPIEESKRLDVEEHRIGSLGLGKKSTLEAIQYAKAMKTFGTSTLDNMTLVRDGITAFADVHHAKMVAPMLAKMKFANQAMYGEEHGAENEKKFMDMLKVIEMRNGLKSEAAFKEQANMIQQVITATGGRVQAEEWLNLIKTGGIAAKGIDNKAFYYKLEPLVQEMSGYRVGTAMMSAYANLYQGRTTKRVANHLDDLGLIADKRKVHNDKVGQIAYLDIGAIKGAALFKKDQFAWMEQVLLASMLRGKLSAAWLASHPKNLITGLKRLPSLIQSIIMRSWLLMKTMSGGLYQAFITASQGAWRFTNTLIRNTANALRVYMVMVYSTVRANGLLGTSKIVLRNAALGLWAALRGGTVGLFSLLASGANLAAQSFLFLSRAILFNPIGLAITAIATAAFLIYRYWQPIKAFFSGFWQGFTEGIAPLSASFGALFQILGNALLPLQPIWSWIIAAFKTAFVWVGQLFQPFQATKQQLDSATSSGRAFGGWLASLVNTVASLVGKFFNFGANIVGGLINGIKSMFAPLKSTWETIVSWLPDRLRKKMDIHSPSRVMAGLGHFIMQGINVGLDQGFPSLKNKFNTVLDLFQGNAAPQVDLKSRFSNALSHMAQSNTPREVFDPIASIQSIVTKVKAVQLSPASSKAQRPMVIEGDTITVQIHAQQGHSVQDLVQQFEQFLQRREREKQAKARTRFFDDE